MKTHRWLWLLAALAVPAWYGCVDDEAGPTVITERGAIQVNMDAPALRLPTGDVLTNAGVVDLDTVSHPTDLFDRMTGSAFDTWASPRYAETYELATDFGRKTFVGGRQWVADFVPDDPRYPFLIHNANFGDTYFDNQDKMAFWSPASSYGADCLPVGTPCWTYSSDYDYMGANDDWYAAGLVRYATKVAGLVDHLEILVNNGVVEEPDTLIPLGGTLAGYPDNQADHWQYNGNDCVPMIADANPFIIGHFPTGPNGDPSDGGADFDGETDADYSICSSGVWGDGGVDVGAQPLAPNDFTSFDLPSYNYLVWWNYDKATGEILYDEPYVRFQIGNDIDLNGDPIPHAFAPFPTAPGRELSMFDSYEEFLADSRVAGGADVVTMTLYNLKPLQSGYTYQIWLYDEVEGDAVNIEATYTLQRPDTTGFDELGLPIIEWVDEAAPAPASSFDGALGWRHIIRISNRALTTVPMNTFSHAVITIGSGDAHPDASPVPAAYRYLDQNGTRENFYDNEVFISGPTLFGFETANAGEGTRWSPFGTGLSQFLYNPDNGEGGISIGLNRLARPPIGYYYAVWVVDVETGEYTGLGEITSPPPEYASLMDADIETNEWVTEGEIFSGGKWTLWTDLPADYLRCINSQVTDPCHVSITLEPKDGAPGVMSENVIFTADIPKDLDKLPKERESG